MRRAAIAPAARSAARAAVVARSFMEISRSRLEGLLASFPKLINAEEQHTFVETESVRYVYQPLESMYLVLITTTSSNILEDLETLRLFAKVVRSARHVTAAHSARLRASIAAVPRFAPHFDTSSKALC